LLNSLRLDKEQKWILQQMPSERQVALFSATMPQQIKRIAQTYLRNPAEVIIRNKTTTAENIRQRYWQVSGLHKLDALTRLLEVESFDGMIVFARTKISTEELASKLEARGFAVDLGAPESRYGCIAAGAGFHEGNYLTGGGHSVCTGPNGMTLSSTEDCFSARSTVPCSWRVPSISN